MKLTAVSCGLWQSAVIADGSWPTVSASAPKAWFYPERSLSGRLVQTLDDLRGWKVSVLAQTGLSFDLSTASGKLMRTIMAGLAEFKGDLTRDRVKSGLAAARATMVVILVMDGPLW